MYVYIYTYICKCGIWKIWVQQRVQAHGRSLLSIALFASVLHGLSTQWNASIASIRDGEIVEPSEWKESKFVIEIDGWRLQAIARISDFEF